MSVLVELNETIQVDREPDKDLGGELINKSQREHMTIGSSSPRIQVMSTLEKVNESQKVATITNWLVFNEQEDKFGPCLFPS